MDSSNENKMDSSSENNTVDLEKINEQLIETNEQLTKMLESQKRTNFILTLIELAVVALFILKLIVP